MLHARVAEDEGSEDQPCAEDGEGPALRPAAEHRTDSQHHHDGENGAHGEVIPERSGQFDIAEEEGRDEQPEAGDDSAAVRLSDRPQGLL